MDRVAELLKHITKEQRGVEIGPYHSPLAPRRLGFQSVVLDVFNADELRKRAAANPHLAGFSDLIEDVDLEGSATEIADLVSRKFGIERFDYVLSSHNFEHIPDPIRFLKGCEEVLKPGGHLSMAIPDHRYCFDFYRGVTDLSEWLEAFQEGWTMPTPAQILRHRALLATVNDRLAWSPEETSLPTPAEDLDVAFADWRRATEPGADQTYSDVHCSVFTPASFELLMGDLRYLGLIRFEVVEVTGPNAFEFYVHLRNPVADPRKPERRVFYRRRAVLLERARCESHELADPPRRDIVSATLKRRMFQGMGTLQRLITPPKRTRVTTTSTDEASLPDEVECVQQPASPDDVDEAGYLAANADVRRSGQSARSHFQTTGKAENRIQWINIDLVRRMRARKLGRVTLRDDIRHPLVPGDPLNALTAEMEGEFDIPEDVPVSAHPYLQDVVDLIKNNRDKLFLDVGAGLRRVYYGNVINTDIYASICTDAVCVGEELPFADDQFDYIFCFAVLEHTKRPWDVAREMCRVLKPGGTIMVDWPFLQPVHGYPHHYFNATPRGNQSLFEEYCDIQSVEVHQHHHPAISVQWILTAWRNGLPPALAQTFEAMTVGDLVGRALEEQLGQPYCTELHPELKKAIVAGSLVVAVKRPVPPVSGITAVLQAVKGLLNRR